MFPPIFAISVSNPDALADEVARPTAIPRDGAPTTTDTAQPFATRLVQLLGSETRHGPNALEWQSPPDGPCSVDARVT